MYLSELWLDNTGPISHCHLKLPFNSDGRPLPTVVVGRNGSGKSVLLSYAVDALVEFAKLACRDIVPADGTRKPYFRVQGTPMIASGQPFSLALLCFQLRDKKFTYCEKTGSLDAESYAPKLKPISAPVWQWPKDKNW